MAIETLIEIEHECLVCGDCEAILTTTAKQGPSDDDYGPEAVAAPWWANDGDRVMCKGCGAVSWVSADEDGACINLDEDCAETVAAYEKRDKEASDGKS